MFVTQIGKCLRPKKTNTNHAQRKACAFPTMRILDASSRRLNLGDGYTAETNERSHRKLHHYQHVPGVFSGLEVETKDDRQAAKKVV